MTLTLQRFKFTGLLGGGNMKTLPSQLHPQMMIGALQKGIACIKDTLSQSYDTTTHVSGIRAGVTSYYNKRSGKKFLRIGEYKTRHEEWLQSLHGTVGDPYEGKTFVGDFKSSLSGVHPDAYPYTLTNVQREYERSSTLPHAHSGDSTDYSHQSQLTVRSHRDAALGNTQDALHPSSSSKIPLNAFNNEWDAGSPNSIRSVSTIPVVHSPEFISSRPDGNYRLTDFRFERTLGMSNFGRVHLARSKHNCRYYAIKVLVKEKVVILKQVEHTRNEKELLSNIHNPFIVNVWGAFQDSTNLYVVMDFVAGGELFTLLHNAKRFPDPAAKFYAAEVALALHHLHSHDIIYRNLKPENILLREDGHIMLTDFCFAKIVPDITWTLCGTPDYLAPEVVAGLHYDKSVDWYALGILIFEMLAGYPPFYSEDPNHVELYRRIQAGDVHYPTPMEPNAIDLVKCFLRSDLSERYGNSKTNDIFAHPWFAEVHWGRLFRREVPAPFIPDIMGDGDASAFERYQETDLRSYGAPAPDPHGCLFPEFD